MPRGCYPRLGRIIAKDTASSFVDFRLQLSSTDYGNFLANEPLPLSTAAIADKVSPPFLRVRCLVHTLTAWGLIRQATEKLVSEFNYLRMNAVQPLAKFLDYMTCVYGRCAQCRSAPD